jgi:ribA/ribD-fused uncharacterized protein
LPPYLQPKNIAKKESHDAVAFYSRDATFSNFCLSAPFKLHGTSFITTEQYYQHEKANFFNDQECANAILKENDPLECSKLGKKVKNYDNSLWMTKAEEVLIKGNLAKYEQNSSALKELLETKDKILGECSLNKIWGTGLRISDEKALIHKNWIGKNLMGKVLMTVRQRLKTE